MIKVILGIIILVSLFRLFDLKRRDLDSNYILISLFVQMIPFSFGKILFSYLKDFRIDEEHTLILGPFFNNVKIEYYFILFVMFIVLGVNRFPKSSFSVFSRRNFWFYSFLCLCFITLVNPSNGFRMSFLPIFSLIVQFFLFLKLVEANFSIYDVIEGLFDGLTILCGLNLMLAILYPILNVSAAVTMFSGEGGLEWSLRRDVASAVGIYGHPGHYLYL